MSEEVAASIGDVLAENARLRKEVAQATERARIASDAYHQQQDAQREHESREQAATERALAAEVAARRDTLPYDGRRRVIEALNVQVTLQYQDGKKSIKVVCILGIDELAVP